MSDMSQNDAIRMSVAVSTAMFKNDKTAREAVYADLTTDELKRTLRWTTRMFIQQFVAICQMHGQDPEEAWENWCNHVSETAEHQEDAP